jgi:hypothetical protein
MFGEELGSTNRATLTGRASTGAGAELAEFVATIEAVTAGADEAPAGEAAGSVPGSACGWSWRSVSGSDWPLPMTPLAGASWPSDPEASSLSSAASRETVGIAVICGVIPPRRPASPDAGAEEPEDASADIEAEAGGNAASSEADSEVLRLSDRAARSSGSPNPSLVRCTGLSGVAPMLPTDRATVGLLPSVGAASADELEAFTAGVAEGAAEPPAPAADESARAAAAADASRWTGVAVWRCATTGSGAAGVAGGPAVSGDPTSLLPGVRMGAPRPARRD